VFFYFYTNIAGKDVFYEDLISSHPENFISERFSFYVRKRSQVHLLNEDPKRYIKMNRSIYEDVIDPEFAAEIRNEHKKDQNFFTIIKEFLVEMNNEINSIPISTKANFFKKNDMSSNKTIDYYSSRNKIKNEQFLKHL
jgi:hypothetical protein